MRKPRIEVVEIPPKVKIEVIEVKKIDIPGPRIQAVEINKQPTSTRQTLSDPRADRIAAKRDMINRG